MIRLVRLAAVAVLASVAATSASAQINPFGGSRSSGLEFTSEDRVALQDASRKLYAQDAPVEGSIEEWKSETGAFGTVLLTNVFVRGGLPCRRLQHDFKLPTNAAAKRLVLIRCQVEDGSWKLF